MPGIDSKCKIFARCTPPRHLLFSSSNHQSEDNNKASLESHIIDRLCCSAAIVTCRRIRIAFDGNFQQIINLNSRLTPPARAARLSSLNRSGDDELSESTKGAPEMKKTVSAPQFPSEINANVSCCSRVADDNFVTMIRMHSIIITCGAKRRR